MKFSGPDRAMNQLFHLGEPVEEGPECRACIGIMEKKMETILGYIGVMEKKMETTTIMGI